MIDQVPYPSLGTTAKSGRLKRNTNSALSVPTPKDKPDAYRFLCSLNTFSEVSPDELRRLAESCRFATLASGDYLTAEGDAESLYGFIVVSGRLAMTKTSINGKELIVELLAPGDILGLLVALSLEKLPTQLSARAQSKAQVLLVPVSSLKPIIAAHPEIYAEFLAYLLHSLQSSYRISRGLAHDRVEVRIATILLSLALKFARPPAAPQDHTIDITRQQIADLTGTTPESAIRVTRSMQRAGLIDIKRPGIVRVLDMEALHVLADGE